LSTTEAGASAPEGPSGRLWTEQVVGFSSGARRLVGIVSAPSSGERGSRPGVVVLHGWGSYRSGPHRMLVEICRRLASRGMTAMRFDFSGRGDSSGDYWDTDLDTMISDARAAGDFLCSHIGQEALAALGLCSGSNVALGAATRDRRFRAVCSLSALPFQKQRGKAQGATRARGTLRELFLKALRPDTYRRLLRGEVAAGRILRRLLLGEGGRSARAGMPDGKGEARNLKDSRRDIQSELAEFPGELLFIYGSADAEGLSGWRNVLEPFMRENRRNYRQLEIPGADHDYHGLAVKERAAREAVEFLAEVV